MSKTVFFNSESEYEALLLENATRKIKTHRGEFYPDCDYGSDACEFTDEPMALYALSAACRAFYKENGIYPVNVRKTENGFDFNLLLNGAERQVSVSF